MPDNAPDAPTPGGDGRVSQQEMPVQKGAFAASYDDQHVDETEADVSSPSLGDSAASAQGNATEKDAEITIRVEHQELPRTSVPTAPWLYLHSRILTIPPIASKKTRVHACTQDEDQCQSIPLRWPHSAWIYVRGLGFDNIERVLRWEQTRKFKSTWPVQNAPTHNFLIGIPNHFFSIHSLYS